MTGWPGVISLFLTNKKSSDSEFDALFPRLTALLRNGNDVCAECRGQPITCISINLGVFICSKCEFAHSDALKRHISCLLPVDSIRLEDPDSWLRYDGARRLIHFLQRMGNRKANEYWEACRGIAVPPSPESDHATRVEWVTQKYIQSAFVGGLYEREVVVKLKSKLHCYHLTINEAAQVELYADSGKCERVECIPLHAANIRPFLSPTGDLEYFEMQTREMHCSLYGEDSLALMELLLSLHRNGCMIFGARLMTKTLVGIGMMCGWMWMDVDVCKYVCAWMWLWTSI